MIKAACSKPAGPSNSPAHGPCVFARQLTILIWKSGKDLIKLDYSIKDRKLFFFCSAIQKTKIHLIWKTCPIHHLTQGVAEGRLGSIPYVSRDRNVGTHAQIFSHFCFEGLHHRRDGEWRGPALFSDRSFVGLETTGPSPQPGSAWRAAAPFRHGLKTP